MTQHLASDVVGNMPPGTDDAGLQESLVALGHMFLRALKPEPELFYVPRHRTLAKFVLELPAGANPVAHYRKHYPSRDVNVDDTVKRALKLADEWGAPEAYRARLLGHKQAREETNKLMRRLVAIRKGDYQQGVVAELIAQEAELEVDRVRLEDVDPEPIEWLVEGMVLRGELTALVGMPGTRKSTFTRLLASLLSQGQDVDGMISGQPGPPQGGLCIDMILGEDSLAKTVRPQLERLGADLTKICTLLHRDRVVDLTALDLPEVERRWVRDGKPDLLVIDPVSSLTPTGTDTNNQSSVRSQVTGPLKRLAQDFNVAVLLVMHTRKGAIGGGGHAQEYVLGSQEWTGGPRHHLLVVKDPKQGARSIVYVTKANFCEPDNVKGVAYQTIASSITEVPGVELVGAVDMTLAELIDSAKPDKEAERADQVHRLTLFLAELLADGPRSQGMLVARAATEGFPRRMVPGVLAQSFECDKAGTSKLWRLRST